MIRRIRTRAFALYFLLTCAHWAGTFTSAVTAEEAYRLDEFDPWLTTRTGPERAKGVIYFIRGWGPPEKASDKGHWVPYFLTSLSADGWDVIGAFHPRGPVDPDWPRRRAADGAAVFAAERASQLKEIGYRKVVIAGHGWGGWVSLLAAGTTPHAFDTAIILSPNGWGAKTFLDGKENPNFRRNLAEYKKLIQQVSIPSAIILFSDNSFEMGERGKLAKRQLKENGVTRLVIDKPKGFSGNNPAFMPIFDFAYGACLATFLNSPTSRPCKPQPLSASDYRSVVSAGQLARKEPKLVYAPSQLLGNSFVIFPIDQGPNAYTFDTDQAVVKTSLFKVKNVPYQFEDGLFCSGGTCGFLYEWSESTLLHFDPDTGKLLSWWFVY